MESKQLDDASAALERAIPVMPPQNPMIGMEIDAITLFDNPETISHWPVVIHTVLPRDEENSGENDTEVPLASIRGVDMIPHVIYQLGCAREILSRQIAQGGPNLIESTEPDKDEGGNWRICYKLEDDGSVTKTYKKIDMYAEFYVRLTKDGQRLEFSDSLEAPVSGDELAKTRSITTAAVLEILHKAGPRREAAERSHILM